MTYLGVDLGGINIAAALVSPGGQIISKRSRPTPKTAEGVADVIAEHVRQLAKERGGDIGYIGIGSPGTIDPKNGVVEYWSNLDFQNVPLTDMVSRRTKLPTLIENDANCAALGEYVSGSGKGCRSMVLITLGTGIGGGAVFNGKLYTGFNHAGMEVGHMVLRYDGRLCTCGRKGCFETYCSATALIREASRAMEEDRSTLLWDLAGEPKNVTAKTVFDASAKNDALAQRLVTEFADHLGSGITSLINILQPEVFCIGGGVAGAGDAILKPVQEILDREDYARYNKARTQLRLAELGNDAGLVGAALLKEYRA